MIETRNKKAIRKIAWRYMKSSKQRNVFIVLAVALSAFLLSAVFSLGITFYNVNSRQQVIAEGTNRNIIITKPEKEQVELAKSLPQCRYAGIQARCAIAVDCNGKSINYGMIWKDTVNWEKQTREAIGNITGNYPEQENQIMTSDWTLEKLGYKNYKVGMEIPLVYSVNGNRYEKSFYLSGYYEDRSMLMNPGSEHFLVSEEFYNEMQELSGDEELSTELGITLNNEIMSQKQIQDLERAFSLNEEQGFYYNEELLFIIRLLSIGLLVLAVIIMLCAYLLVYNILFISFTKEVQTYGLLKTLGMTRRQMKRMLLYQILLCLSAGLITGILAGMIISGLVIPSVVEMINPGMEITADIKTNVFIILWSVVFITVTVFISSFKPIKTVEKLSPVESMKYNPVDLKKKTKKGRKGGKIFRMALYNITCRRRKAIIVFSSLCLSTTIFLFVNIYTNSINGKDYINAYMPYDVILRNETRNENGNLGEQVITRDEIDQIQMLDGIKAVNVTSSDTITVYFDEKMFGGAYLKEFCDLWMNEPYEEVKKSIEADPLEFYGCLVAIDDGQLRQLISGQEFDFESFDKGETCIIQSEIPLENCLGEEVSFAPVENNEYHTIRVAAIVEDNLSSYSGIAPNIYVSDKVISSFVRDPWIERINVTYDKAYDQETENRLTTFLQGTDIELSSKIQMMENTGNSKEQMSMLGNGVALILAIIGLLNFANIIIAGIYERKYDFILLNNIGMTQKQIRKMVTIEGMVYGIGTIIFTLSFGIAISVGGFYLIKEPYMKLHFPFVTIAIALISLAIICTVIPAVVYKKFYSSNVHGKP